MPRDWVIHQPASQRDSIARALRVSPIVAQVLCNRGVTDDAAARRFLKPSIADLPPPEELPGATHAAERILDAVRAGRKIVIFGDYDVDGVTAVSILWHCLRLIGADPQYYIPHRLEEGYGISADALRTFASEGAQLVITVDCGITAVEPARLARELGVELIITDHHTPCTRDDGSLDLPDAILVHPGLPNGGASPYPNRDLCGAGVAFKLAWAIAQCASKSKKVRPELREFLLEAVALAAMGTVADVVPLVGENRTLAYHGLLGLQQSKLHGIRALLRASGLADKKVEGFDVGFRLGPRLNAIGRMGHARLAVDLLTRASPDEATRLAEHLDQQNQARKTLERRILTEARAMVAASGQDAEDVRAIVLASPEWHAGVIGIVAGRIAEAYCKPAVLIALENGVGQGSARSIRNFPLNEALADCREHLISFGGHAMAAGLKIAADRVDPFREALRRRATSVLTPRDMTPKLHIDDVVELRQLDAPLVADLARLEPFGAGNPAPLLATETLELAEEPRAVGSGGAHLQVTLREGRARCKGIAFGQAAIRPRLLDQRKCRVAFSPIINEWNGRRSVEMQIADFQFPKSHGL